jgi:hypothetical protein
MQRSPALNAAYTLLTSSALLGCVPSRMNVANRTVVDRVLTAHANAGTQVPAPASLTPQPWKVGQWALYERDGVDGRGYERISVVAEDACGVWFVDEVETYNASDKWTVCLRRAPGPGRLQIAISEANGGPPQVVDFHGGDQARFRPDLVALESRLTPPDWREDATFVREDVDAPAGHFAQAIRTSETPPDSKTTVTRWSHPAVPVDATIRTEATDGRGRVLLTYGDDDTDSVLPDMARALAAARQPRKRAPIFFGLGYAEGWLSGGAGAAATKTTVLAGEIGVRVASKIELLLQASTIEPRKYSPDPTLTQEADLVVGGVRWNPFGAARPGRPPSPEGIYLRADAGYAWLSRGSPTDKSVVARGFAIGASLGWSALQAQDWVGGIELGDRITFLDSGEGTRHSVALLVFYELYFPPLR